MIKHYLVLVTGDEYFLTPCVIIKAKNDDDAWFQLKQRNKNVNKYRVVLDKLLPEETGAHLDDGVYVAESAEDISQAF